MTMPGPDPLAETTYRHQRLRETFPRSSPGRRTWLRAVRQRRRGAAGPFQLAVRGAAALPGAAAGRVTDPDVVRL